MGIVRPEDLADGYKTGPPSMPPQPKRPSAGRGKGRIAAVPPGGGSAFRETLSSRLGKDIKPPTRKPAVQQMDVTAQTGGPTVDWLKFLGPIFQQTLQGEHSKVDYSKPPASPAPAKPNSAYTGTYANNYYGPITVSAQGGQLTMQLGPKKQRFALRHYDGDTFSYSTTGEMSVGLSGVTFTVGSGGHADKVRVENLDTTGLGTFTRND